MPDKPRGGNELIQIDVFEKAGIAENMHVGDLGCGNLGHHSLPSAKIVGKDGIVYAVDILKSVLESVERRARQEGLDNLKVVWSNLEMVGATKIPAESLDVILIINILFQSKQDDQVLKEAYRLAKKGAKLLIIDWSSISAPFGPPIGDRIKPDDAKNYAIQAGFQLVEEFKAGPYHFGLIFEK